MTHDFPGLIPRGDQFTIRFKNRNLYADHDPVVQAEVKASSLPLKDYSVILLASPLLWYGVDTLLEHLPANCHIICMEKDADLKHLEPSLKNSTLPEDPRISVVAGDSVECALDTLNSIGIWRFRRCQLVSLNGGYALHASFYRTVQAALQENIEIFWKNRMTLIHMVPLWIKNLFLNLSVLLSAEWYCRLKVDKPVFIAGAGESLEGILPYLKENHSRLFLLCVDTALPVLLSEEIRPDAVICLESQVNNLPDFIGSANLDIPLLCDLMVHPSTFRILTGKRYLFLSRFSPNRLFDRMKSFHILPPSIPPLGSVGVAAVYVALQLTAGPVFFAGLDFSFTPGKTHCRGTPGHMISCSKSTRISSLDDIHRSIDFPGYTLSDKADRPVRTTLIMDSYRKSLASIIHGSNRVYNVGSTGLKVDNALSCDIRHMDDLIQDEEACRDVPGDIPSDHHGDGIPSFLENEENLLSTVFDLGNSLLKSTSRANMDDFLSAVEECDYLLLHFPDPERLHSCDREFIARLCAAAGHYRTIIRRVRAKFS